MSSTSVSSALHNPAASSSTHSESSIITSAGTSTVMSARDSVNSTGPSPTSGGGGPGQMNNIQVAPNGRATSESNSDKLSSRTPSPHPQQPQHHQITNGGWPNLGMDSKKNRYVELNPLNLNPSTSGQKIKKSPGKKLVK